MHSSPTDALPILEARGLTLSFDGVRAVDGIDVQLAAGHITAVLGPNGAGKTTLLRMLSGVLEPDAGELTYRTRDGRSLTRPLAAEVGYLPEDRGLYPDQSLVDTLVYMARLRGMRPGPARTAALEWLERLDLADRVASPLKDLSKGNQQRVQFASAVVHSPRVAFLDEPFSGLDPVLQERFLEILRGLANDGMALLVSAHQLPLVERVADHVQVMAAGCSVLELDASELSSAGDSLHERYLDAVGAHETTN